MCPSKSILHLIAVSGLFMRSKKKVKPDYKPQMMVDERRQHILELI